MVYIGSLNEPSSPLKLYIDWLASMIIRKGSSTHLTKIVFHLGHPSCLISLPAIPGSFSRHLNVFSSPAALAAVASPSSPAELELVNSQNWMSSGDVGRDMGSVWARGCRAGRRAALRDVNVLCEAIVSSKWPSRVQKEYGRGVRDGEEDDGTVKVEGDVVDAGLLGWLWKCEHEMWCPWRILAMIYSVQREIVN